MKRIERPKRVVLKLSGERIGGADSPFDDSVIGGVVRQIAGALQGGRQISLVMGGGNILRGRAAPGWMCRTRADQIGMLGIVMNAIYLGEAFRREGVSATVMTPIPIGNFTALFSKDKALKLMSEGTVVINAAGLGHPLFSSDTVTALRACELEADMVLFAKTVDGVYTKDPRQDPGARKFRTLSYGHCIRVLELGKMLDTAALSMLDSHGVPSYVFRLDETDSIARACGTANENELEGTLIAPDCKEELYGHQGL